MPQIEIIPGGRKAPRSVKTTLNNSKEQTKEANKQKLEVDSNKHTVPLWLI